MIFLVECYEEEVKQTKKLTNDMIETKDYVNTLTKSLNDIEKKCTNLKNEYDQYKIDTQNSTSVLINKLNASEEIVKQLFPGMK